MSRDLKFLEKLLQAKSPSGVENEATRVWNDYMGENTECLLEHTDNIGNSGWCLKNIDDEITETILISAHIDEIAMAVTYIGEDGYLSIAPMAGPDKKCLPGSKVLVMTDSGDWISGIVQKAPIHIDGKEETVSDFDKFKIDLGCESKEEVENLEIYPGAPVVFERNINLNHGTNRLYGNALDDKIGIYIISQVAKRVKVKRGKRVIFLSTTQEESGLRGASIAAAAINPDISIDIDVTFACDGGLVQKEKYGDIHLGKGPVIEFGQDKSRDIASELISLAKKKGISIQRGFSRCGGTNTNAIQLRSRDCKTALISIPNMSMHTPNETCDWRDIDGAIELLVEYISER